MQVIWKLFIYKSHASNKCLHTGVAQKTLNLVLILKVKSTFSLKKNTKELSYLIQIGQNVINILKI